MKLVVVTPSYPPTIGGLQHVAQRLVESWPGVPPTVITVGGLTETQYDEEGSTRVVRVGPARHGGMPATMAAVGARLIAHAATERPSVVLSLHVTASPSAVALSYLGLPFVQYVHGTELHTRATTARLALHRAGGIVAVSNYTRRLAVTLGADPAKTVLIPPGVDIPRNSTVDTALRPTIITVARLDDGHKGHDVMLDAVLLVRGTVPDVHWVVIGDGKLRWALERRSAELGLAATVTFMGAVSDASRDDALARAHVFAMPSRIDPDGPVEGYGIAYVEAGAHGLPVVGGNVAGARDAVDDGITGILVDPTNPAVVASCLVALLTDPARRRRMGQAGREKALAQTWPVIAHRLEAVVNGVLAGRRP